MIKGLEALEDLYEYTSPYINVEDIDEGHANTCYQVIQKELKALEILRECNLTIDEFNKKFDFISGKVPKDKVDLLKEVL